MRPVRSGAAGGWEFHCCAPLPSAGHQSNIITQSYVFCPTQAASWAQVTAPGPRQTDISATTAALGVQQAHAAHTAALGGPSVLPHSRPPLVMDQQPHSAPGFEGPGLHQGGNGWSPVRVVLTASWSSSNCSNTSQAWSHETHWRHSSSWSSKRTAQRRFPPKSAPGSCASALLLLLLLPRRFA